MFHRSGQSLIIMPAKIYGTVLLLIGLLFSGACNRKVEPVIISKGEPGQITFESAVIGGSIVYGEESGITNRGMVWDTLVDPALMNNSGKISVKTTDNDFEAAIDQLEPETTSLCKSLCRQ